MAAYDSQESGHPYPLIIEIDGCPGFFDERVRENLAANQATLAAAQRDADRAQGFADHFTAQRQVDNSPYARHVQQISEAWQQVAA